MLHLLLPLTLVGLGMLPACRPSQVVYADRVQYNYKDEGFLSPDVLQTIAKANTGPSLTLEQGRQECIREAESKAKRRALRVILHTRFMIKARKSGPSLTGSRFEDDYPFSFTERDFIRGELDFEALLGTGYIALQDARESETCTVVYRIEGTDIPALVRMQRVTFRPEGLK
ncbi:MAG: hypothetical protein HY042_03555 [Spirochaetia bacterium]|nr:hypothetical protein [Spirochaetia bacterium]